MPFTTVIIHWTGPYTHSQLKQPENREKGNGIYLLTGRCKYERTSQFQYCGITKRTFHVRLYEPNHHIEEIHSSTPGIWLGEVIYPNSFDRSLLETAEHCFVHFSGLYRKGNSKSLNKVKLSCPREPICFVSQWFTRDEKPRLHRPPIFAELPDIM